MNRDDRVALIGLGAVVSVIILLLAGAVLLDVYTCSAKWRRSGMATSWGPIQGCLVEVAQGTWIPEERVREVDLPREGRR